MDELLGKLLGGPLDGPADGLLGEHTGRLLGGPESLRGQASPSGRAGPKMKLAARSF